MVEGLVSMWWVLAVVAVLVVTGACAWLGHEIRERIKITEENARASDAWLEAVRASQTPAQREQEVEDFFAEWEDKNRRGMPREWN